MRFSGHERKRYRGLSAGEGDAPSTQPSARGDVRESIRPWGSECADDEECAPASRGCFSAARQLPFVHGYNAHVVPRFKASVVPPWKLARQAGHASLSNRHGSVSGTAHAAGMRDEIADARRHHQWSSPRRGCSRSPAHAGQQRFKDERTMHAEPRMRHSRNKSSASGDSREERFESGRFVAEQVRRRRKELRAAWTSDRARDNDRIPSDATYRETEEDGPRVAYPQEAAAQLHGQANRTDHDGRVPLRNFDLVLEAFLVLAYPQALCLLASSSMCAGSDADRIKCDRFKRNFMFFDAGEEQVRDLRESLAMLMGVCAGFVPPKYVLPLELISDCYDQFQRQWLGHYDLGQFSLQDANMADSPFDSAGH